MREIKFRAWEKSYKRMSKVTEIKWKEEHLYHQIFTQAIVNNKRIDDSYTYDFSGVSNGIVLMQYTGLKDKNGVEIYEGDVLGGEHYFRGEGWFDTGEGEFSIDDPVIFKDGKFTCRGFDLCEMNEDVEVIGSIYDNPELMEGKK